LVYADLTGRGVKRNVGGYTFADPFTGEKIDMRFFLAGGGAQSTWYKSAIQSLDPDQNQAFYGVKRIRLETVGRPRHFHGDEFPRFVNCAWSNQLAGRTRKSVAASAECDQKEAAAS
jgi:hypothetical protein